MTNPVAVDTTSDTTARRSTRRALLGLGAVGAALATSRTVSAAADDSSTSLATFIIGAELAARDLYRAAPDDMLPNSLTTVLALHHEGYAERVSGIVGQRAIGRDDALFDSLSSAFEAGDLDAALELENSLAATHAALLAETDDVPSLRALASIVSAESRHAAVVATEAGAGLDAVITNPAAPLAPEA